MLRVFNWTYEKMTLTRAVSIFEQLDLATYSFSEVLWCLCISDSQNSHSVISEKTNYTDLGPICNINVIMLYDKLHEQ